MRNCLSFKPRPIKSAAELIGICIRKIIRPTEKRVGEDRCPSHQVRRALKNKTLAGLASNTQMKTFLSQDSVGQCRWLRGIGDTPESISSRAYDRGPIGSGSLAPRSHSEKPRTVPVKENAREHSVLSYRRNPNDHRSGEVPDQILSL